MRRYLSSTVEAFGFVSSALLRDRQAAADALRNAGSAILDRAFERRSPIPALTEREVAALQSGEMVFPFGAHTDAGNQSVAGVACLIGLARLVNARRIFEIGTYNGRTAYTLARNVEKATVLTLDLPVDVEPAYPLDPGDEFHLNAYSTAVPEHERVIRLFGDSASFDFEPYRGSCDVVYVDGAHSYEYAASDSYSALRLVSSTGVIVWDDYMRPREGVVSALHQLAAMEMLYRVPRTRIVVLLSDAARQALAAHA